MSQHLKNFLIFFIVFLIIAGFFSLYQMPNKEIQTIGIDVLIEEINNDKIKGIEVEGSKVIIILKDGKKQVMRKEPLESLSSLFKNYNVNPEKFKKVPLTVKEGNGFGLWLGAILPFLIPFLLIGGFIYLMMRQVQGTNMRALMFGQAAARETPKDQKDKITFQDVAGVKEAKEELLEVVEFLKSPQKFTAMGARIPKGVLLVGPPGTGKTLLARAVAGEANVPFFHMSGSEFVELFVGVGASRVRSLFQKAKKSAPCIVFIDELDAVGRQRGAGLGGSHDEREQTLNQILVEMDGFEPNSGVVVMSATNRPDVLDPALLRPGRFDRRIILDMPDIVEREAILKTHSLKKPLSKEVSLRQIAERTPGFSGADLANLLNEAAILAARRQKKDISTSEILESTEKVLLGPERKSHILSDKEKRITAYHEAGHALTAYYSPLSDPVQKVSIVSRGRAAGYTLKMPIEDRHLKFKAEYLDELTVLLGGWVTEKEIFNDVTTGAASDLKEATRLTRMLITQYGMSEKLGPRTFGEREELIFLGREIHEKRDYGEKIAQEIDKEVSAFIGRAKSQAKKLILEHKDKLEKVVLALLEKETLEKKEFEKLMEE